MDFTKLLKDAGFNVSNPPAKIDSKHANLKSKINIAEKFIQNLDRHVTNLPSVPDEETFFTVQDSIVLNFQRFCEAVKDLLDIIATKENVKTSDNKGIRELIRKTANILVLDDPLTNAVSKLTFRNDTVHDYMNADYNDDIVVTHVTNDIEEYKRYIDKIKEYFTKNNMI